ncbi:DinB family protein [Sciscionella sediminilitoris]|uniref:DinB family protein n=1 Tax=Sciscionella sediminilitoris TaxID=1445613 RepID=UPI0004DFBA4A|nr:DinB family protein [Sciscionella sp. SE31]
MTTIEHQEAEKTALLAELAKQRGFLHYTARELTDEQAKLTPTASECCVGGLIKHVTVVEDKWTQFMQKGASPEDDFQGFDSPQMQEHMNGFRLLDGETLDGILAEYERVAARTEEVVRALPNLEVAHQLPKAPWNEPGEQSARTTLLHILAETAQHSGHADIIRETIDGQKTMG